MVHPPEATTLRLRIRRKLLSFRGRAWIAFTAGSLVFWGLVGWGLSAWWGG